MSTQMPFRRKLFALLPFAVLTASVALTTGCNSGGNSAPAPTGGATQLGMNDPNASPILKAQAAQQQQMGQQVNQALAQAHAREVAAGKAPKS